MAGKEALAAGVNRNMPEGRLDVRRQKVVAGPQQLGQRTDVLAGRWSLDRSLVQSAKGMNHAGFAGTCGMHAGAREKASATRCQVHVRSPRASLFLIGEHKGDVRGVHEARTQAQLAHGSNEFHLDPLRQPALHERWGRLQGVQITHTINTLFKQKSLFKPKSQECSSPECQSRRVAPHQEPFAPMFENHTGSSRTVASWWMFENHEWPRAREAGFRGEGTDRSKKTWNHLETMPEGIDQALAKSGKSWPIYLNSS